MEDFAEVEDTVVVESVVAEVEFDEFGGVLEEQVDGLDGGIGE